MSKVSIQGDASGTGTLTIAAPNTNSNYTLTLPTETGTIITKDGSNDVTLNDITASGIYLGGTGAANYLDDYEEGTWTPVAAGSGGAGTAATYSTQIGTYTKIGRIVIMKFLVNLTSAGSEAGNARIAGFPFSGTTHTGLVRASTTNTAIVGVSPRGIYTGGPGNAITLDVKTGASTAYSELTYANFFSNTTSVLGEIIIEV